MGADVAAQGLANKESAVWGVPAAYPKHGYGHRKQANPNSRRSQTLTVEISVKDSKLAASFGCTKGLGR